MPLGFRENGMRLGKSWGGPTACAGPVAPPSSNIPVFLKNKGGLRPPQAQSPPHKIAGN